MSRSVVLVVRPRHTLYGLLTVPLGPVSSACAGWTIAAIIAGTPTLRRPVTLTSFGLRAAFSIENSLWMTIRSLYIRLHSCTFTVQA